MPQAHHLTVPRSARYLVQGELAARPAALWFACHGYGQLAERFLRRFAPLDDGRTILVAPEALSRFYLEPVDRGLPAAERHVGATWMTREDREADIADNVRYLELLHAHVVAQLPEPPAMVHALGFSQGAATVVRWAALGAARLDRVTLWAGTIPPELDLARARERLAHARLTLVMGTHDRFAGESELAAQEARLRAADIPFRTIRYDGGHEIDPEVLAALARE